MKIKITLKDPNGFHYSLKSATKELMEEGYSEDDEEIVYEHLYDELFDKLHKWFSGGEYLTVEYDTEKDTITILPNKRNY